MDDFGHNYSFTVLHVLHRCWIDGDEQIVRPARPVSARPPSRSRCCDCTITPILRTNILAERSASLRLLVRLSLAGESFPHAIAHRPEFE